MRSSLRNIWELQVEWLQYRDEGVEPEALHRLDLAWINTLRKVADLDLWRPSYHSKSGEGHLSVLQSFQGQPPQLVDWLNPQMG